MKFYVVNSFAERPFGGNPAAVFPNAAGLGSETMQAIARQMNLVESVFVLPGAGYGADFHLKYFTPTEELPVAGHPTIAAFVALAECGRISQEGKSEYKVQTGKGIVDVIVKQAGSQPVVYMAQPAPCFGRIIEERSLVAEVLGISTGDLLPGLPVLPVDTGLGHLIVPVLSLAVLMNIQRKTESLRALCKECGVREVQAFAFETYDAGNLLHTRNICPREGIEDPACGVGNGALGAYLLNYVYADKNEIQFKAEQGNVINMPSIINVSAFRNGEEFFVNVGGSGAVMIDGCFHIN